MKAIAVADFAVGPTLMELPVPQPGPGEVLVRVAASSLNGFDVTAASGYLQGMMEHRFPVVLGKDFAGTVEAIGEGVTAVGPGDDVFGVLMRTFMGDGTFAEYVTVPEAIGLAKRPAGLEVGAAGALGLAGAAAATAIDALALSGGQTVLVVGATGGVGALALQLARAQKARVIATAQPGEQTRFVQGLGATDVVDYSGDLAGAVRDLWPDGVDALLQLAGDAEQLVPLVRTGGRFVSTLGVSADQLGRPDLTATAVMATPSAELLEQLAAQVGAGELLVSIEHTYRLAEVPQALQDFAQGTLGKLAVAIG